MAVALIFGVQASELRTKLALGHYDAQAALSPLSRDLYQAVYKVIGVEPSATKALIWNDYEQQIDQYLARIVADLKADGAIVQSMQPVRHTLQ
jgi:phenylalanine ammonia-lyase